VFHDIFVFIVLNILLKATLIIYSNSNKKHVSLSTFSEDQIYLTNKIIRSSNLK
jgi:hypothetical protein